MGGRDWEGGDGTLRDESVLGRPTMLDFLPGLLGLERDNVLGDCGRDDGREGEGSSGRVGVPAEPPLLLSRLRTVGMGGLLLRGSSTPGGSCPGGYSGTSNEDSPLSLFRRAGTGGELDLAAVGTSGDEGVTTSSSSSGSSAASLPRSAGLAASGGGDGGG